ncbi:DNA polymerase (fragment) [Syntrophobacter sp. SbD2]
MARFAVGLIYAMGAEGLRGYARVVYNVDLTLDEAQRFRSTFFEVYCGIAAWHRSVYDQKSRETRTLIGRGRLWNETPKITALYNSPVQGIAADITKKALSLLPQRLADTGAKIIGTVHDEIILEVRNEMAREAAVILDETMIQAGKVYLGKVPVEVEITIGETWSEK